MYTIPVKYFLQTTLPFITFFVLLAIFLKITGPLPFTVTSTNKNDGFSISGTGEASGIPDQALLTVGVQTQGPTVKNTQDSLNSSINQVIDSLKKQGINQNDIQTQSYNLNPIYQIQPGNQKISSYQANSTLIIKINDISKVNSIIDSATISGANQIANIEFSLKDPTKIQNLARQKAVDQAKSRAEAAAKTANFHLGRLINYSENINDSTPTPMLQDVMQTKSTNTTELQPGANTTHIEVTLTYDIY